MALCPSQRRNTSCPHSVPQGKTSLPRGREKQAKLVPSGPKSLSQQVPLHISHQAPIPLRAAKAHRPRTWGQWYHAGLKEQHTGNHSLWNQSPYSACLGPYSACLGFPWRLILLGVEPKASFVGGKCLRPNPFREGGIGARPWRVQERGHDARGVLMQRSWVRAVTGLREG